MVYEEASYDEPVTGMEEESTPGFGALLVFEGLLCIAFLLQRRNS
ncbi:PGF-CTERM sorting domain-containing protein [Methanosarcina sp. DH2]|jgi:PGF-CTERM protein|nr:PGF-CTERM sorting domain-containing protein [Methanosarcina sp. DH2]MCC4771414.1 PGF-CTERM sorting domain-containing protein [Methanosarcina sp. DH2]